MPLPERGSSPSESRGHFKDSREISTLRKRIAFVGAGAIGGYVGAHLFKAGYAVTLDRSVAGARKRNQALGIVLQRRARRILRESARAARTRSTVSREVSR